MRFDPLERWNLGISTSAVAVSALAFSPAFTASLGLGAAFGALNFRALVTASHRMFDGTIAGSGPWVALFGLRFVMLAVAIGLSLQVGAQAVPLVIGLSLVIPATIIGAWRMRPAIDPDAPALDPDDPSWDQWNPWLAREQEEGERETLCTSSSP